MAIPNEILRSVVGSGVHGIAIAGTDDHDEMGVYIEPPSHVLGLERGRDDYVWRTQPEGVRSGHGDTDLILYSLRKYLRVGRHERMLGGGSNRVPNRPELIERQEVPRIGAAVASGAATGCLARPRRKSPRCWAATDENAARRPWGDAQQASPYPRNLEGWDVKFGSHALRLAHQGHEIASRGTLTLPMPDEQRERVLSVKRGEVPREEVSAEIAALEARTRELLDTGTTPLPPVADIDTISSWAVDAQRRHWGWVIGDTARM